MAAPNRRVVIGVLSAAAMLCAGITADFEGYRPVPYVDHIGKGAPLTACRGHTGADVQAGRVYSEEQCAKWFGQDLAAANAVVRRCAWRDGMPVEVEAAMTDLAYNVGAGAKGVKDGVCTLKSGKPSTIRRKALAGDWAGVCDQFRLWGPHIPGIDRRRAEEAALCRRGIAR